MTMGNRIAEYRKKLGLTQDALAQKLNVSNQAVSKWESDQCCPDIQLLPRLADVFGISLDELFGRRETATETTCKAEDLPWKDDDVLRVVMYLGRRLIASCQNREGFSMGHPHPVRAVQSVAIVQCGDVAGNVDCTSSVTCGNVRGNVDAGTDVHCGNVAGNVDAGTNVTCEDVHGNVDAGTDVRCGGVGGDVDAGLSVNCGDVEGSVDAGTDVRCGNIGGDVDAGDCVECGAVGGDIDAGGSVTVKA